jgi:hypothetical protein
MIPRHYWRFIVIQHAIMNTKCSVNIYRTFKKENAVSQMFLWINVDKLLRPVRVPVMRTAIRTDCNKRSAPPARGADDIGQVRRSKAQENANCLTNCVCDENGA